MATLNDFKILNQKCLKFFKIASSILNISEGAVNAFSEDKQRRFGFYYLALQFLLNEDDFQVITDSICDCEFNSDLFNVRDSDEGIDAVSFDEENKTINVFNFKFRNSFSVDKSQSINDTIISSKFFDAVQTGHFDFSGKVEAFAKKVIELNNSPDIWKTVYYVVTNDNVTIDTQNSIVKNFASVHGIDIQTIGLDKLVEFMSIHPNPVDAELVLDSARVMAYSENELASDKSYNLCLYLTDLLRITCNDDAMRNQFNLEDESSLSNVDIEYSVLYENVRGYIMRSKYNAGIIQSLKDEPEKFFYFNNGITIVAEDITSQPVNSNKKIKLKIKNFQVLNGGQTLRTIHKFNSMNPDNIINLSKASVMVRVMKVTDEYLKSRISEYTNSQNAISQTDLKSMRTEQVQLQMFLNENNICYIRKNGDTGDPQRQYEYYVSLSLLGQILYAVHGYPGLVSNKKKDIFGKEYDMLFKNENLLSQDTVTYIKSYFTIKECYKCLDGFMELKVYFVLYLGVKLNYPEAWPKLIDEFESFVGSYQSNEKVSRFLLKQSFMDDLKRHFGI